jgi:hypothetical protein
LDFQDQDGKAGAMETNGDARRQVAPSPDGHQRR